MTETAFKEIEIVQQPKQELTKSALPKRGNNIIKYLAKTDIDNFMNAIPYDRPQDRVLFSLMWLNGLRVTEVISLEKQFYDKETHTLTVKWLKNRTYSMRTVPLRPEMEMLLIPYMSHFKYDEKVFPVTRQYVHALCKKYCIIAGLPSWVHPHTFRHSFAVNFYNQTKDIIALKSLLGHARISTTTVYSDFSKADLRDKLMTVKF